MIFVKKEQQSILSILVKVVLFLLLAAWVMKKLVNKENLISDTYHLILNSLHEFPFVVWLIPILLIPINWGIESKKWQMLAGKLKPISYWTAFEGVLTGLSVSFITPHSFGDYVGRIWQIDHDNRESLLGSIMLGRFAQMLATLFFGTFGLLVFFDYKLEDMSKVDYWLLIQLVSGFLLIITLFLMKNWLIERLNYLKRFFGLLEAYEFRELVVIVLLSFVRYLVFSVQFVIVLWLLKVDLSMFLLFAGTTFVLFFKSVIPTFNFLSDLGIRSVSTLMFFELFLENTEPVLAAAFVVWVINILIPSLLGSFFIFKMRIFRN